MVLPASKCLIKASTVSIANSVIPWRVLPQRTGAHPLDHAITSFNHVRLPGSSLLGSPEKPINDRDYFTSMIHRVAVGTLLVASPCIPALQVSTFNASQFSFRREVTGYGGKQIPIIEFRTQQLPILHAIAQCNVLKACLVYSAAAFTNGDIDIRVRHAIAAAFKAVAAQHCLKSLRLMNEGCGWHGYFEHNQILQLEVCIHPAGSEKTRSSCSKLEGRSAMTAEGDIRVLAIRMSCRFLYPHSLCN
jgi:acyl-CoA oxidase